MMYVTKLAKEGIGALRSGDISKPAEWILSRTVLKDRPSLVDAAVTTPEWIDTDASTVVDARSEDYYVCLGSDTHSLTIEPPEPADAFDFTLVDTRHVEEVSVEARIELVDGTTERWDQRFTEGRFFDDTVLPLTVPVSGQASRAEISVDVAAEPRTSQLERLLADTLPGTRYLKTDDEPRLSVPAPRVDGTPVFLISIDTFRYDFLDAFSSAIDALGPNAVIPREPRTQGTWTRPAHSAMLTGAHPGRNGLFGYLPDRGAISSGSVTLAELLSEQGYKCSAFTASPQLLPGDGFARGFHRYRRAPIEWKVRQNDAADVVDRAIQWVDRDRLPEHGRGFYFLHLLDPHFPYLPPFPLSNPELDLSVIDEFDRLEKQLTTYLEILNSDQRTLSTRQLNILLSFYRQTLEYVSNQLARLFEHLEARGLLSQSLVIVTGDHGEEFFERKFGRHESVHDANTRVGTVVKPPADSSFRIPDRTDTIDFVPTIARHLGVPVPDSCDGTPWQDDVDNDPRIVERFGHQYYILGVESDGLKGIYVYEPETRGRPSPAEVDTGPLRQQYYRIADVRAGNYDDCRSSLTDSAVDALRTAAEEFLLEAPRVAENDVSASESVSDDLKDRLEELGYV